MIYYEDKRGQLYSPLCEKETRRFLKFQEGLEIIMEWMNETEEEPEDYYKSFNAFSPVRFSQKEFERLMKGHEQLLNRGMEIGFDQLTEEDFKAVIFSMLLS